MTNKNMLNLCILDVLKEYSDEAHQLTQQNIICLVERDFGLACERKAVGRNIVALMEYGFEIERGSEGYYLAGREFDDSEILLLVDSVYFSPHIAAGQAKALIEKLKNKAGPGFGAGLSHVSSLSALHDRANKQFFYTLQTLNEGIGKKCKISCMVNSYGADKKLHPRRAEPYIVNPYRIVAANGRYYLIGNHDRHDNIAHIRVDRITNCVILDEKAKPMELVQGLEHGLDLPKYLASHAYMRLGEAEWVKFRVRDARIDDVMDWFGRDVSILPDEKAGYHVVNVKTNRDVMKFWALQFLEHVEVMEPADLREEIAGVLRVAVETYASKQRT